MICCLVLDASCHASSVELDAIARACSPRVEAHGGGMVFDASGLTRVLGPPAHIAREVQRLGTDRGLTLRVAIARTTTPAWLLAHARAGTTVVSAEHTATALAGLPLRWLATLPDEWILGDRTMTPVAPAPDKSARPSARHYRMAPGPVVQKTAAASSAPPASPRTTPANDPRVQDLLATLARWGLATFGDLARLPRPDVRARLGPAGARLHQAASGEDVTVLVPAGEAARFVDRMVLDWPLDALEPLSFVLARLLDELSVLLERADRGAVEVTTRLQLVTREMHVRVLHLPAPMREARTLRTLILLDLEAHPPPAGVDVVEIELGVVPGRIVQGSLLTRALPTLEDLATLTARLYALMGDTRVGAPKLLDTHDDRAISVAKFSPESRAPVRSADPSSLRQFGAGAGPGTCLRRFRLPVAARVTVDQGAPAHVAPSAYGLAFGDVVACAGPWRSSGHWWTHDGSKWDRDEWDVELPGGHCYRLSRDRVTGRWEIEGELD
jgi:hypothetical protein